MTSIAYSAGKSASRMNVVAVALFLITLSIGVAWSIATKEPGALYRHASAEPDSDAVAQNRSTVGARGGAQARPIRRAAGSWALLDRIRLHRHRSRRGSTSARSPRASPPSRRLTSDTVPVNVDAVLFWMVHDAQKAALEVQDYAQAVSWARADGVARHHRPHDADRSAARARAHRGRAAAADRPAIESVGRHRVSRSRCATSSFPARCRTPCRARRRRRARSRRASSSARPRWRSRTRSRRPPSRTTTTRPRFTCAR